MSQSPQTGQVAAKPLPTEAEILNLIRQATVGNASAQVDLGNLFSVAGVANEQAGGRILVG